MHEELNTELNKLNLAICFVSNRVNKRSYSILMSSTLQDIKNHFAVFN
jgi:hypothetical protein